LSFFGTCAMMGKDYASGGENGKGKRDSIKELYRADH
jgi:hypothetical protein